MLIRRPPSIPPSELTPPALYKRRKFLRAALAAPLALAAPAIAPAKAQAAATPDYAPNPAFTMEARGYGTFTPKEKMAGYNNFYELGTDKRDPAANSHFYRARPWRVAVSGEVAEPLDLDVDDLLKLAPLEERVYRLRCVEAWSMVIPWMGFSLSALVKKAQPTGKAKFVEFITFNPDELFPENSNSSLPWPYVEGLRMDEAMHPLAMLVFGVYGELLPTQCGAPVRLVAPWKYGFKSGKALVAIRFLEKQPATTWNVLQPGEYGFYANVNPNVSHPRWSQASERAIGGGFLPERRKTDMFNGYAEEVAGLYSGMDLQKQF